MVRLRAEWYRGRLANITPDLANQFKSFVDEMKSTLDDLQFVYDLMRGELRAPWAVAGLFGRRRYCYHDDYAYWRDYSMRTRPRERYNTAQPTVE